MKEEKRKGIEIRCPLFNKKIGRICNHLLLKVFDCTAGIEIETKCNSCKQIARFRT